jgi:hypothetical protein
LPDKETLKEILDEYNLQITNPYRLNDLNRVMTGEEEYLTGREDRKYFISLVENERIELLIEELKLNLGKIEWDHPSPDEYKKLSSHIKKYGINALEYAVLNNKISVLPILIDAQIAWYYMQGGYSFYNITRLYKLVVANKDIIKNGGEIIDIIVDRSLTEIGSKPLMQNFIESAIDVHNQGKGEYCIRKNYNDVTKYNPSTQAFLKSIINRHNKTLQEEFRTKEYETVENLTIRDVWFRKLLLQTAFVFGDLKTAVKVYHPDIYKDESFIYGKCIPHIYKVDYLDNHLQFLKEFIKEVPQCKFKVGDLVYLIITRQMDNKFKTERLADFEEVFSIVLAHTPEKEKREFRGFLKTNGQSFYWDDKNTVLFLIGKKLIDIETVNYVFGMGGTKVIKQENRDYYIKLLRYPVQDKK